MDKIVQAASGLIASRAAIIFWTNLAVVSVEILFDAIQIELERRGVKP